MREMKDSGIEWIGEIPKDWESRKLSGLLSSVGSGTTPKGDEYYSSNGYPWLITGDLNDGYISETSKFVTEDALRDCCDVTASSFEKAVEDSGEISVRGIDKSFGMKKYIEAQGLSREDTIAFGDGPNDVDMIAFAGTGVVMGNGRPELKAQADFVTKSVDEDGIAYALEKLGLI